MKPARSGIADYSAALVEPLQTLVALTVFDRAPVYFDPSAFDIALYQLGNNADHVFVYEMALRYPGVAVLHEANLHHLIADLTIRRGDWDAYVEACAFDGGAAARDRAEIARGLSVGPDYENIPMLRRIAAASRGVIAHSRFVMNAALATGFAGPHAVIPHGAWVDAAPDPEAHVHSRGAIRHRLGIDETTPLIGAFGYLKPYKRIAETLRALRRLVRVAPSVRMILGGEPHPDLPIRQLIQTLELDSHVRLLGYTPENEFAAYIAACDIVVNLRHPTVGETSGSLLRAFSAGRPALVSEVGAFAELPDDVCLKVQIGPGEEDLIFEYLELLVTRPEIGRQIGARARAWVEKECGWRTVAQKYADFLSAVVNGGPFEKSEAAESLPTPQELPETAKTTVDPEYLRSWAVDPAARDYFDQHSARLAKTLEIIPPGDASQSILEMGAYLQITPALREKLGYGLVRGCYFGKAGRMDRRVADSSSGGHFECIVDHFDAEKDRYPYEDASFDTILCCELIEHLPNDPMFLMSEVNRILKPGGHFVLTTPNIISYRAVSAILNSYHPGFFTNYIRPQAEGANDARHNREYAPSEIQHLLTNSGFEMVRLETGPFRDEPHPEFGWVKLLLENLKLQTYWRGDGIYAVGRKTGPILERWPGWLYA
jgi:glycosyltransferase involved in cell wall biosynthesis/SAM-dependent methyltransferase